jgi:hypothetical protein
MLDGPSLPAKDAKVELRRGSLSIGGEIAWQRGNVRGIRFGGSVNVADWVRRPSDGTRSPIDRSIGSIENRRPAPVVRETHANAGFAQILAGLAQELEQTCGRLARSPVMTAAFGEDLVRLDALAHRLRTLSRPLP